MSELASGKDFTGFENHEINFGDRPTEGILFDFASTYYILNCFHKFECQLI